MSLNPPPIYEILADENGKAKIPWIQFFNQNYTGDKGTTWTPTFTSLGSTGTPTITGRYMKLVSGLCYFIVKIVPATDTSSVGGTTFINNFPLNITNDGGINAVSGGTGGVGQAVGGTTNIYTPTWTNVTVPVTITGLIEAT